MAAPVREQALNEAFADLAGSLVGEVEVSDLLHQLVTLVGDLLSADSVSVMLREEQGELQVLASSTEATRKLELYQLRSGQGPGLECLRTGRPVSIPDLDAASERWELFVPTARELGVAAVHAVPMRVRQQFIGALDLYSLKPGDLPADDLRAAQALADVAAIGVLQERASRQRTAVEATQDALHGQFLVEQAKGMLAASADVGIDEAFDLLRHFAAYRDDRLVEVAADLAAGRVEPGVVIAAGRLTKP